ncbi:MAG: tetratricopeptide repeat protein [Prevotella sp.]|nr:tetratricopeptide repeat protein [Prevotella sp.]
MNNRTFLVMALSLLLRLPSLAQEDRKALRDSLKLAMEQLSYHPDSVDLRLRKAAWNMQLGEWQYAKDEYDWVINHHPDNLAARYYRAYANTQLRRYNFARLDYETVLRVVPGNFDARLGLALLNQKDHHYTEAMDGVNMLVSTYPDSATAWAARAGIEKERDMKELAAYDYGEALRREPDNRDWLLARADLLIALRRYNEARKDLDRLVALGVSRGQLRDMYRQAKE